MASGPGKKPPVDISHWMETQNKDYSPSSLDRYLYYPESPNNNSTSPRWDSPNSPSASSSYVLSPSLRKELSCQYSKGEMVAVRCNRHKWLLGEVKRLSQRGVRVWVGEAGLLVNVPQQLLATHLLKMSSAETLHSLPPSEPRMVTTDEPGKAQVHCVRPAHLSHRKLYIICNGTGSGSASSNSSGSNNDKYSCCTICGQNVITEDEAVAPWDCDHNCHIDCIQDKPKFFSTTSCPICKDNSSISSASVSPSTPDGTRGYKIGDESPPSPSPAPAPAPGPASSSPSSSRPLRTIDEGSARQFSKPEEIQPARTGLKSAIRKPSVSFSVDVGKDLISHSSSQAPAAAPAPAVHVAATSSTTSLADRMKKFSMPSSGNGNGASSSSSSNSKQQEPWVTVIKDGQNTRQTASQQRIEHMARAKENTFSAKAKQQQQQK